MLVPVSGLAAQTMRTAIAFSLMVPLLSACGSASEEPAAGAAASNASSAPLQSSASAQSSPPGGTWTGTLRRQEEQTVEESGGGTASKIIQTYDATVTIRATAVDAGRWTLAGQANIIATFSSDWVSRQTSPLGPCNQHFTDDAEAKGTGAIEGGLEIDDGFFQLTVRVPGVDGTKNSVRDDTGCFGSRTTETNPWPAAEKTLGESGQLADPNVISVTRKEPDGSTVVTTTWNLRRTP
jgi:hypothetical protein